ncbi:mobilization domain protein, partial [Escherichia coli MP020940.1]
MFALLYQPFVPYLLFSLYNWLKRSVRSLKCCTWLTQLHDPL